MMLKAIFLVCLFLGLTSGQRLSQDPFFVEEPENVTIITGKKVMLKCVIGNANGRSAQWTFDNFGLGLDRGLTDWPHLRMVGASPKSKSKCKHFDFPEKSARSIFSFNWKVQLIKWSLCWTLEKLHHLFPLTFQLCFLCNLAKDIHSLFHH